MKLSFGCFLLALFSLQSCSDDKELYSPQKRAVVEAVYASAILSPSDEYDLVALAEGQLLGRFVNEGDTVLAGQQLFEIRNVVQEARLQATKDALTLARENAAKQSPYLSEQANLVENAKARYINDSTQWQRYASLAKAEIGTKEAYDRVKLAYQTSKNDWLNALSRYNRAQDQSSQEKLQAEAAYATAVEEMRNYRVKADRTGTVFEVFKEAGEMVRRGELLAVLGASGATLLKLKVDEADIRKVKVGQQVLVRLDILPDSIFEARVSRVYPRLSRKEQAFTVDAVFDKEPGLNLSGLNAEANIIIQKRTAVLTIPKTLLQNDSVWLLKEGKEVAQRVRTGISDDEWIEIVAGLNENDVLIQR